MSAAQAIKVGVMAHTHDNPQAYERAIKVFNEAGVKMVIHAGDFVAPFSLKHFEKLACPWIGVFGMNDGNRHDLQIQSEHRIQESPYVLNLGGIRAFVIHSGQEYELEKGSIKGAGLIIVGQPYTASVNQDGGMLVVMPGDCSGYVADRPTVCIYDSAEGSAQIIEI